MTLGPPIDAQLPQGHAIGSKDVSKASLLNNSSAGGYRFAGETLVAAEKLSTFGCIAVVVGKYPQKNGKPIRRTSGSFRQEKPRRVRGFHDKRRLFADPEFRRACRATNPC
jgi:hypothetical protein